MDGLFLNDEVAKITKWGMDYFRKSFFRPGSFPQKKEVELRLYLSSRTIDQGDRVLSRNQHSRFNDGNQFLPLPPLWLLLPL